MSRKALSGNRKVPLSWVPDDKNGLALESAPGVWQVCICRGKSFWKNCHPDLVMAVSAEEPLLLLSESSGPICGPSFGQRLLQERALQR